MTTVQLAQQRVYAWLIDALVCFGLNVLLAWTPFLSWCAVIAYVLLRDGLFDGQSIGKRLLGLKVLVRPGNTRCLFTQSIARNVLWVLFPLTILMGLTGLHYLFHDPQGRHWGDRLANTEVAAA